jgi:uncharacterized protein YqeY
MSLQEQIKENIKEAMKAKESVKLDVLRGISTAFMNELVNKGRKPQDILSDEEALAVIVKIAKQRKDSIEQFEKGGRSDLAKKEKEELAILEKYLPETMSKDDIKKIVQAKIEKEGKPDSKKLGGFIGGLMKELKGKADGADVKEIVEELVK